MNHPYVGISVQIPTKHHKGAAIQQGFAEVLDISCEEVAVDTDLLGTFAGEIERTDTPFNTALKKIELLPDAPYLIASEGSIGNDPDMPFFISDVEMLLFKDRAADLLIAQAYKSFDIKTARIELKPGDSYDEFLSKADFPRHSLIAKSPQLELQKPIKGIKEKGELARAISTVFKNSETVILESDLRAHHSPSRMANIQIAANKLALRIATLCPACATPGFGLKEYARGVICVECKRANSEAISQEILGCIRCEWEELGKIINKEITPDKCIWCNP